MRSKYDIGLSPALPQSDELTQRIIENYRLSSQPVRPDYLEYLAQKSLGWAEELERKQTSAPAYNVEQNTRAVVDRVYAILEAYAMQLNKVSRTRDLFIAATAPAFQQEVLEFDRARQPTKSVSVYRGRFSTNKLSLFLRGMGHNVEFFLLPVDRIIGLSRSESEIGPLMIFQSEASMAGLSWFVESKPLTADRLERYSLLALEHLLDKTRQEVR